MRTAPRRQTRTVAVADSTRPALAATIAAAEIVVDGMDVVDRTGVRRLVEAVAEAPLDLVAVALVRARGSRPWL
jgi:hypothetical protein